MVFEPITKVELIIHAQKSFYNSGYNMVQIGNDWDELLKDEWEKPYYRELRSFLLDEYENETVYPPAADIFAALRMTPYSKVKVVILGQDPYHEPGQAVGLAFSVPADTKLPPSLVNILKELESDTGANVTNSVNTNTPDGSKYGGSGNGSREKGGVLAPWAEQGVLLLNTVLTVRAHQAASHKGRGWEQFTDRVIELLAARRTPMVFVLWGAHAISKKDLILRAEAETAGGTAEGQSIRYLLSGEPASEDQGAYPNDNADLQSRRHLIITAPHPSPLSAHRGFFGGRYFSRCNYFLADNGIEPIDWSLK